MLAFPLITKLKCSHQTVPLMDMFSFTFQLSTWFCLVLQLPRDVCVWRINTSSGPLGARRTIIRPPFSHVPHAFYLYPGGNVGYDYYIGVRFGDMANAFFLLLLPRMVDNYPPPSNCFTWILLIKHAWLFEDSRCMDYFFGDPYYFSLMLSRNSLRIWRVASIFGD
jgi:hypothetical protein